MQHDKTYASLEAGDEVFDVGLNRAVTLIAEKSRQGPERRPLRRRSRQAARRSPERSARVAVKSGRYGAYVTAGGVNATIPSDKTRRR